MAGSMKQHYIINSQDSANKYKIYVSVHSKDEFYFECVLNPIGPTKFTVILKLELGSQSIESKPDGIAINYIRGDVVNAKLFNCIPSNIDISDNNLAALIDHFSRCTIRKKCC